MTLTGNWFQIRIVVLSDSETVVEGTDTPKRFAIYSENLFG